MDSTRFDNAPARLTLGRPEFSPGRWCAGDPAHLAVPLVVESEVAFDLDLSVELLGADGECRHAGNLRAAGLDVTWLPRGEYRIGWTVDHLAVPPGEYRLQLTAYAGGMGEPRPAVRRVDPLVVSGDAPAAAMSGAWSLAAAEGTVAIEDLSWKRGHENWFFRHFDHAARTIISYMLGDSPLLAGRVLDVGCGDGITDLAIALRCRPQRLVGIDPFRGYERLPEVMAEHHLPLSQLPDNLSFLPADGNHIPFADDSFDVVLSWGSLEHIAGGYHQTLLEIKRVLKNGGLLFAHPGLYYSNYGHHIGEFTSEPFVHLTRSHEEIRQLIFDTPPKYMDRAGEFAGAEDYWRWYNELNPITVAGFEAELKALDFEFYRVALRTQDLIEYHHPALQDYGMQDLATVELYLSAWNRKSPRPEGFRFESLP